MRRICDKVKWLALVALVLLIALVTWWGSYILWLGHTAIGVLVPSRRRWFDDDEDD
jgi:hypothetical protein